MGDLKGDATKSRLFAAGLDNLLAMILCILIAAKLPGDLSSVARWGIAVAGYLAYFMIQEAVWGTTIWKRVFGLTITHLDGSPVSWPEAWWRTLFRILEVNPLLLGALPAALIGSWSKRKQRLGDMVAGTVVVTKKALVAEEAMRA